MVKVVRWTPSEPAYRNTVYPFGQIFEELWRNTQPTALANSAALRPAMDVVENDNEVVIRMDLPGLSSDDLNTLAKAASVNSSAACASATRSIAKTSAPRLSMVCST
jgi:HSP20 family molecular chaperone IbpA